MLMGENLELDLLTVNRNNETRICCNLNLLYLEQKRVWSVLEVSPRKEYVPRRCYLLKIEVKDRN